MRLADSPPPLRTAIVFGTRPEAIKLAPVIAALRADAGFAPLVVVTGQHREMLDDTLRSLGITADLDLDIMRPGRTLNDIVAAIVPRLDALYAEREPDWVVVQGDTTSAFCAALVAFHRRVKVAHVEAGLRSGDRFHPYPEEVNRRMIGACADLHFPPTTAAAARLAADGAPPEEVVVTGNTAIDALELALLAPENAGEPSLGPDVARGPVVVVTLHRREAWSQPGVTADGTLLHDILEGIRRAAVAHPHARFVYPVHMNPRVRAAADRALGGASNVRLVTPMPYVPFVQLMRRARLLVTDSGGIQEEGPSLGVPVLVLRKTTERAEALATGMNRLVGTDPADVEVAIAEALAAPYAPPATLPLLSPFGDGRAAARIRDALLHASGRGPAPVPFEPPAAP